MRASDLKGFGPVGSNGPKEAGLIPPPPAEQADEEAVQDALKTALRYVHHTAGDKQSLLVSKLESAIAALSQRPAEQASGETPLIGLHKLLSHRGPSLSELDNERLHAAIAALSQPPTVRIGAYGSAFDPPNTCRAFTYAHQPGNVLASRLGGATDRAANMSAGDSIDRGLCLLHALEEAGFGVYQLAPQQPEKGEG